MRALLVVSLLLMPALAGCAVPSGVNEDAYDRNGGRHLPPPPPSDEALDAFVTAMRQGAKPRPALADEAAYDRFFENATQWAESGVDFFDYTSSYSLTPIQRDAVRLAFGQVANATRGSDKEVLGVTPLHLALAFRHNLTNRDAATATEAGKHVAAARRSVGEANASVHEVREQVAPAGRNALLRAEAVLGVALVELADAEAALATPGQGLVAAQSALDARIHARATRFWLDEARRATGNDSRRLEFPTDLEARATRALDDADALLAAAATESDPAVQPAVSDLAAGKRYVLALRAAGLPEGAFAASQGLQENVLVLGLAIEKGPPGREDVAHAWDEAARNVRTFRDAQRYDRALATVESVERPFSEAAYRLDYLRAYAALALMRTVSEEREHAFGAPVTAS